MKRKIFSVAVFFLVSLICLSQEKSIDTAKNEIGYWQSLLVPALIAVIGYLSKSIYEVIVDKEKRRRNLLEDKLKNFYWPILTRLEENNAIWKLILNKRKSRYDVGGSTIPYPFDHSEGTEQQIGYYSMPDTFSTPEPVSLYGNENINEIERTIGLYVEQNIVLKNHREIMEIIMTNRFLAKFDTALSKCLQDYIRHVAIYEGILSSNANTFPGTLGAPYPQEFDEIIKSRTIELQQKLDKKTLL